MATRILKEENLALVVVRDGKVIFKSIDRGIKPMYTLSKEMKDEAKGASIADKVIGKGAAILCGYIGIKYVYTDLLSNGGVEILKKHGIPYQAKKICPYIKNRDKTDYCPIEKLSQDIEDPELFIIKVGEFLASINQKKGES